MILSDLIQKLKALEDQYGPTLPVKYHDTLSTTGDEARSEDVDFVTLECKGDLYVKLI